MSSDIEKLAVLDSRIVQSRPKFAVEKGALSLTNAPFNAIASTSSQMTFNVYVPSENVFLDRKLLWSSSCFQQFNVNLAVAPVAGESLCVIGRDLALCALPLNQLCSTMSATINDTTSVINSQDVLREVLRLTDSKGNRLVRTAPTMLDKYASYNDAFGALNNPLGAYNDSTDYDNVQNGAFRRLEWTSDAGAVLPATTALSTATPAFAGAKYRNVNGVPVCAVPFDNALVYVANDIVTFGGEVFRAVGAVPAGQGNPPAGGLWVTLGSSSSYLLHVKWTSTEPLCLSPFVFSDECEWDTGLFGLNNIQLIMNFVPSPSRILRTTSLAGRNIRNIAYNEGAGGVFNGAVVNCQFLTPSLDVPLPPKSVVPYMEFPRYISQDSELIAVGDTVRVNSQTITLPNIPDLLIIYVKSSVGVGKDEGDYYLPIGADRGPLSINFDNFSGLLSSTTKEQLYNMSVHNGLNMDYSQFCGEARSSAPSYAGQVESATLNARPARQQGQLVPTVGSILVLKPSQDLTLQSGQAPSLVGNFTLQFSLSVKNTTTAPCRAQIYVITANSGFFESIRGSSRIIKGVLSEQDIISAPLAPMGVRSELNRIVGGFSFSSLSNILSKAKDIYSQTKPLVSAVKGLLPQDGMLGSVRSGLDAVGYGTGAGTGGRKHKSLASRLM
jgi:hypothetical protein